MQSFAPPKQLEFTMFDLAISKEVAGYIHQRCGKGDYHTGDLYNYPSIYHTVFGYLGVEDSRRQGLAISLQDEVYAIAESKKVMLNPSLYSATDFPVVLRLKDLVTEEMETVRVKLGNEAIEELMEGLAISSPVRDVLKEFWLGHNIPYVPALGPIHTK